MADIVSHFNAANVHAWSDANVYIAPLGTVNPVQGAPFGTEWQLVGALDGSAGFQFDRKSDQKKFYGWGTGVLIQTDKNYEESITFTALEDNATVRGIVYPGSTFTTDANGATTGVISVPRAAKIKLALEMGSAQDGLRYICRNYAILDGWPSRKIGEDDIASQQIKAAIIADANKGLWDYYETIAAPATTPAP